MESDRGIKSLKVWQKSVEFATEICNHALHQLPVEEKYCLASQLRRAAQSIPANIAEGYGRYYYQETIRFCYIARGSLEETYSHLTLARKLEYLNADTYESICEDIQEIRRMLNGYISFLKQSKRGSNEPGADLHLRELPADYLLGDSPDLPPD